MLPLFFYGLHTEAPRIALYVLVQTARSLALAWSRFLSRLLRTCGAQRMKDRDSLSAPLAPMPRLSKAGRKAFKARETAAAALRESLAEVNLIRVNSRGVSSRLLAPLCGYVCVCVCERERVLVF